jgi:hypothetical protein
LALRKGFLVTSETDGGIQAVKAGRNQALWREVNERIKAVAETSGDMEFLCECANMDCSETLAMSMAEYERIRSSPSHFPIAVGHDFPEFERVVELTDGTRWWRRREQRQRRPPSSTRAPMPKWKKSPRPWPTHCAS